MDKQLSDVFWANVDKRGSDECWDWLGQRLPRGYGRLSFNGKQYYAHRLAYELAHGAIGDGMVVCHSCDRPQCCAPHHLWEGSQSDNMVDCLRKGRHQSQARALPDSNTPASGKVFGDDFEWTSKILLKAPEKHVYLGVTVPKDHKERLETIAGAAGLSMSEVIRRVLETQLPGLEKSLGL